ncbi:MAG TPA: GtrA family protein [Solirubrobacteraceae bacterium]|nr:GtrA family protein [Solirubrobacteraceae bacterium]
MNPRSEIFGQGVRFLLAGSVVLLFYVLTTTFLATVVGMPFQAALAIGYATELIVHFTLQRVFVWTHHDGFALAIHHQVGRYLLTSSVQYVVTAVGISLLPSALGLSSELVYLGLVPLAGGANFMIFRHGIFHASPSLPEATPALVAGPRYAGDQVRE